jgi:hypothetical protein
VKRSESPAVDALLAEVVPGNVVEIMLEYGHLAAFTGQLSEAAGAGQRPARLTLMRPLR